MTEDKESESMPKQWWWTSQSYGKAIINQNSVHMTRPGNSFFFAWFILCLNHGFALSFCSSTNCFTPKPWHLPPVSSHTHLPALILPTTQCPSFIVPSLSSDTSTQASYWQLLSFNGHGLLPSIPFTQSYPFFTHVPTVPFNLTFTWQNFHYKSLLAIVKRPFIHTFLLAFTLFQPSPDASSASLSSVNTQPPSSSNLALLGQKCQKWQHIKNGQYDRQISIWQWMLEKAEKYGKLQWKNTYFWASFFFLFIWCTPLATKCQKMH